MSFLGIFNIFGGFIADLGKIDRVRGVASIEAA